jgi:hypothetical protein
MVEYVDILNKTDSAGIQTTYVAFNNHFARYGPQSANTFLGLIDKPEIDDWTKEI